MLGAATTTVAASTSSSSGAAAGRTDFMLDAVWASIDGLVSALFFARRTAAAAMGLVCGHCARAVCAALLSVRALLIQGQLGGPRGDAAAMVAPVSLRTSTGGCAQPQERGVLARVTRTCCALEY